MAPVATAPFGVSDEAVAMACNPGSYQKACALLRSAAVSIMGQAEFGGVQAVVKSERGGGQYTVTIGANSDGKARAKCTCVDFKTRGGLCKHGAAALLALGRDGCSSGPGGRAGHTRVAGGAVAAAATATGAVARGSARCSATATAEAAQASATVAEPSSPGAPSPVTTPPPARRAGAAVGPPLAKRRCGSGAFATSAAALARPAGPAAESSDDDLSELNSDEENQYVDLSDLFARTKSNRGSQGRGRGRGCVSGRGSSVGDVKAAPACSPSPSSSSGGGDGDGDDLEEEDGPAAATPPPPALPQPRFPSKTGLHSACGGAAKLGSGVATAASTALTQRRGAVRAAMAMKLLQKWAGLGRTQEFKAELKRWGDSSLEDAAGLLRRAVEGEDEVAAPEIASVILARPEGRGAASAPDAAGKTLLHAAAGMRRLEVCRALVAAKADICASDSAGRTPLDVALAKTPRETKGGASWTEQDPLAEFLREAATKA